MSKNIINIENPFVQSYSETAIVIDKQEFNLPLILTPKKVILDELPLEFNDFYPEKVASLLIMNPELILIGTGTSHSATDNNQVKTTIGIDVMTTGAACRIFNVMIEENRNALAALY